MEVICFPGVQKLLCFNMALLNLRKEGRIYRKFQDVATTLEQTFAGWKPGHQLRMQSQSEPSVVVNQIASAPRTSPTLANPSCLPIYFSAYIN